MNGIKWTLLTKRESCVSKENKQKYLLNSQSSPSTCQVMSESITFQHIRKKQERCYNYMFSTMQKWILKEELKNFTFKTCRTDILIFWWCIKVSNSSYSSFCRWDLKWGLSTVFFWSIFTSRFIPFVSRI